MATIAIDARIIASSTGRYVERLINYLEKLDTANTYYILVREKDKSYYAPTNPNFHVKIADFADYSLGEQLGFATFLKELNPDLVHFCMPQQPLLYTRPAVTTIHDLNLVHRTDKGEMGHIEFFVKQFIFKHLLRKVAKRTNHIIVPTDYTRHDLLQFVHIPEGKITRTYEDADTNTFPPQPVEILEGKQFIMYVGRAEVHKNNRRLIQAHQQLLGDHPNLHLAIVGKIDELRQADIEWTHANNFKNVDFLGFISDNHLNWLYKNTAGYIVPSLMEGFGLPGLEAMKSHAPVISSNATCLPEVYQSGAHYFDPLDIDAMAHAINDVLTDKNLAKTLINNGEKVASQYSWERMAQQTLNVYNTVLKTKK
jgi:glycosyltransferase involved in cell wall biosynthesis